MSLGVDACKAGWVGIVLSQGALSAYAAAGISDLVDKASEGGPLAVIAIDIPIGLPDTGRRQADLLARRAVGPRWASVFITPVRPALEASDYLSATTVSLKLAGEGISRQAFALQAKILQVDRWVRHNRHRVVEVHPEASFAQLGGAPRHAPKSTWAGIARRRQLLAGAGVGCVGCRLLRQRVPCCAVAGAALEWHSMASDVQSKPQHKYPIDRYRRRI